MAALASVAVWSGAAAGAPARPAAKPVKIAYLSFAVANSYDAPMLAAAKAAAQGAAARDHRLRREQRPEDAVLQLQTVATSKQYDAIIVQPIFGTGLISARQAGDQGQASRSSTWTRSLGANLGTASRRWRAFPATSSSCRR